MRVARMGSRGRQLNGTRRAKAVSVRNPQRTPPLHLPTTGKLQAMRRYPLFLSALHRQSNGCLQGCGRRALGNRPSVAMNELPRKLQVINAAEVVGEVFTDILGLTNPRYEWAVEAERNRVVSFLAT